MLFVNFILFVHGDFIMSNCWGQIVIVVADGYWKMDVGLGTNEKELILVLGHRNAQQRKEIKETYQKLYNESLIDHLQSELSGDFRVCYVMLNSIDLSFSLFIFILFCLIRNNS